MSSARPFRIPALVIGLCALAGLAARASAGVSVGLTPATQNVTPGGDFDVFVDVLSSGSSFNGFDAVVIYDPAALTFVPQSPTSLQQGCLMTGSCSSACGNTFHRFSAAADSLSVSDVLLCNQTSLTGPGHLYQLHFHASNTAQVTHVTFRSARFYDAGVFVTPVQTSDATIGIGVNVGVGPGTPPGIARVRVEPNPSFGRVAFVAEGAAGLSAIQIIQIVDLQGRVVRELVPGAPGAGARLAWDGRDERGVRVAAGVYLARIHQGGSIQHTRVVLLP